MEYKIVTTVSFRNAYAEEILTDQHRYSNLGIPGADCSRCSAVSIEPVGKVIGRSLGAVCRNRDCPNF